MVFQISRYGVKVDPSAMTSAGGEATGARYTQGAAEEGFVLHARRDDLQQQVPHALFLLDLAGGSVCAWLTPCKRHRQSNGASSLYVDA